MTPEQQLTFDEAMTEVLDGHRVTRLEWEDPTVHVFLRDEILHIRNPAVPRTDREPGEPDDGVHVLKVSEADLRGEDWVIAGNGHPE